MGCDGKGRERLKIAKVEHKVKDRGASRGSAVTKPGLPNVDTDADGSALPVGRVAEQKATKTLSSGLLPASTPTVLWLLESKGVEAMADCAGNVSGWAS